MKYLWSALCFFYLSSTAYSSKPFNQPQLSFNKNYSLRRSYNISENRFAYNLIDQISIDIDDGEGVDFAIEVPYHSWQTIGFAMGMFGNVSLKEIFEGSNGIDYDNSTLTTVPDGSSASLIRSLFKYYHAQFLLFTKFQYPINFSGIYLSPFVKFSSGFGLGTLLSLKSATAFIPLAADIGFDIYVNKWFGLNLSYQIKYDLHHVRRISANFSSSDIVFESSLSAGIKSTYL